jgi:hypothetical protein
MKRDAAATIFRTVVFAGAMLGAPACSKKPAAQAPKATTGEPAKGGDAMMQGETAKKPTAGEHGDHDPCAGDPCAGDPCGGGERPRGGDDEGGGVGRGFILS